MGFLNRRGPFHDAKYVDRHQRMSDQELIAKFEEDARRLAHRLTTPINEALDMITVGQYGRVRHCPRDCSVSAASRFVVLDLHENFGGARVEKYIQGHYGPLGYKISSKSRGVKDHRIFVSLP
jgi:hypothetical protein